VTASRPCSAATAAQRALSVIGQGGEYELGGGDYDPVGGIDLPWTRSQATGRLVSDCSGFAISWCYQIPRHRPGFNRGDWATVSDDVNPNSAIEDAAHDRELFERAAEPFVGALICYPTIHLPEHELPWIGHVKLVTGVSRVAKWDPANPDWSLLDTAECCGPPGRRPGAVAGTGASMVEHDRQWPKPEHRTAMLRVVQ
jgi:hypothetical protein